MRVLQSNNFRRFEVYLLLIRGCLFFPKHFLNYNNFTFCKTCCKHISIYTTSKYGVLAETHCSYLSIMELFSRNFHNLWSLRSDDSKFIITGCNNLLSILCKHECRNFFVQTVSIVMLESLNIINLDVVSKPNCENSTKFMTAKVCWWINLYFSSLKCFYGGT